jgi:hypothetical protein
LVTPKIVAACHSIDDAWARQPVASIFTHYPACLSRISLIIDSGEPKTLHFIDPVPGVRSLVATLAFVLMPLSACSEAPPEQPADAPAVTASTCGGQGVVQATLTGAIEAKLDWPDTALRCESMPRPDAEGIRLRFSGLVGNERLDIIIAMPELNADSPGGEFDSNVTVSVEGSGRFFSTPNLDTCWTVVAGNEPLVRQPGTHMIIGSLSCVGPLGEVNGDGFVDIPNFRFSGIANWSAE